MVGVSGFVPICVYGAQVPAVDLRAVYVHEGPGGRWE